MNSLTHFEIFGSVPELLVDFYQKIFGWKVEQMPGINYWRVDLNSTETKPLHGGLSYSAIPGLSGWLFYVDVTSLDETEKLIVELGGSIVRARTAVPKTAWVTIVADPAKNMFGVWQADPIAFPTPDPSD